MENRQYDVTALGELLIDFTENGDSSQGNPTFEANPGGAPCNVLAMLTVLAKNCIYRKGRKRHVRQAAEGCRRRMRH